MENRTILHVAGYDKFTKPILDKLISRGDRISHQLILCREESFPLPPYLISLKPLGLLFILTYIRNALHADRIVLHGLFEKKVILSLFLSPFFLNKVTLMVWGGDVYNVENELSLLYRFFYRFILRRISVISTTVPGDYDFVKEKYGVQASFVQSLMYYSHVARIPSDKLYGDDSDSMLIQVGNSADPLNNHLDIFNRLPSGTPVFAPLAYGNREYGKRVVVAGRDKFGDHFDAMTDFISFDEYTEKLSKVTVAIFNHSRQAAMGNCIAFLSLGKKLYIRSDTTPWPYFKSLGFYVFDTLGSIELEPLRKDQADHNIALAKEIFTEEALLSSWDTLVKEGYSG